MRVVPSHVGILEFLEQGRDAVKRAGFALTHERFLTSTASQGQTLRTGVTIDCARIEPNASGKQGASDDQWWLHLYVMLSRATCMEDMLLLRPPPRALLNRSLPVLSRNQSPLLRSYHPPWLTGCSSLPPT